MNTIISLNEITENTIHDDALEEKICTWLDKNGILMETPGVNFKRDKEISVTKLNLDSSGLFRKRSNLPKNN